MSSTNHFLTVDLGNMPQKVTSHQDLHCLLEQGQKHDA